MQSFLPLASSVPLKVWGCSEIILTENLTSLHEPSLTHSLPRAELLIAFCFRGDNDSLTWNRIAFSIALIFYPSLTFTFSIPRSIPTSSRQLAAAGAPSTMAMLYRSVTAQARDERQIKTTLFPLSPSRRARLNLRFFIFFLIFLFSLELPGITWNLAVSQFDDAVSFMHIETESLQSFGFFLFVVFFFQNYRMILGVTQHYWLRLAETKCCNRFLF